MKKRYTKKLTVEIHRFLFSLFPGLTNKGAIKLFLGLHFQYFNLL